MTRLVRVWGLVALAALAGCSDSTGARGAIVRFAARFARLAATATGQPAVLADAVSPPVVTRAGHPGFDTGTYPGDAAMRAWRQSGAPYEWAGYYLQSPCHPDDGWMGKRQTILDMGYGLAVIYVGQQTWGRTPGTPRFVRVAVTSKKRVRVGTGRRRRWVTRTVTRSVLKRVKGPAKGATCDSDFVTPARGAAEGRDAVARAASEGFPPGTTIFLDLERMDVLPNAMRAYYTAWTRAVLADGRYRPGIYAHDFNVRTVYTDVKGAYAQAGIAEEPPFWVAKGRGFDLAKLPSDVGHAFAAVWQGILDVEQTWAGHRIPIDVNVAATRSPSDATLPLWRVGAD